MSKEKFTIEDLERRLFDFPLRVLNLVRVLPRTVENRICGRQLIRSSSSMGANVIEATCAHTKKDFTHSLNTARKEAKESLYWLRLIAEANPKFKPQMKDLLRESEELVRILSKAVKTAKEGKK